MQRSNRNCALPILKIWKKLTLERTIENYRIEIHLNNNNRSMKIYMFMYIRWFYLSNLNFKIVISKKERARRLNPSNRVNFQIQNTTVGKSSRVFDQEGKVAFFVFPGFSLRRFLFSPASELCMRDFPSRKFVFASIARRKVFPLHTALLIYIRFYVPA